MTFNGADDIVVIEANEEALWKGAQYAAVTLPWTFDRMMLNTVSRGQQYRALNISKGIVAQEMLRRWLTANGINCPEQAKSHRDTDFFDFEIEVSGILRKFDIKTGNYYSDYSPFGRAKLSPELIEENRGYCGPDWRRFFPMLVPHTQIRQNKEAYIFAISSSRDFRNEQVAGRERLHMCAFPAGIMMGFLSSKRLCLAREQARKGYWLELVWRPSMLGLDALPIVLNSEWDGDLVQLETELVAGKPEKVGPIACLNSIFIDGQAYLEMGNGCLEVRVCRNSFDEPVFNSSRTNVNVVPTEVWNITRNDFCNVYLPDEFRLYVIGFIYKPRFIEKCRNYTGWVWPDDRHDPHLNQPWTRITEGDERTLRNAGFGDAIPTGGGPVAAGWMKTTGGGNGACCYVYPNVPRSGGVNETNLYVLPQDLNALEDL